MNINLKLEDFTFELVDGLYLYSNKDTSYFGYYALISQGKVVYTASDNTTHIGYYNCFFLDGSYSFNSDFVELYSEITFSYDFMKKYNLFEHLRAEQFVLDFINEQNLLDTVNININKLLKNKFIRDKSNE